MTRPSSIPARRRSPTSSTCKTFPGKRALQKNPFVNLEWALIADGVPAADVYKVLNTPEGVDRAFKKLDTIKSEVIWWEAGAQPPQILADGQASIVSAWNGRIFNAVVADKKPFKIVWDQQGLDWDWWAIPKGTPKLDAAYKFLSFASGPEPQAEQTKYISYGPANMDAVPNIDPAVLPNLPTAPDNMKTALVVDPAVLGRQGRGAARALQRLARPVTDEKEGGNGFPSLSSWRTGK